MSYNLVCFYYSNDSVQLEYLQMVTESITNLNLDVVIEIQNETDARWSLYSTSDRFPAFILFRDNARKSVLIGKHDIQTITDWLTFNLS